MRHTEFGGMNDFNR